MDEQTTIQPVQAWMPVLILPTKQELALRALLAAKISKCYESISAITKTGFNQQNNYKFASTEAIYGQVRAAAFEAGIAIVPLMGDHEESPLIKDDGARRGSYLKVSFTISIIDTETGYTIAIPWIGEVMEYGDKAFNKASTAAMKYALRTLFMIPTDASEDPDSSSHDDRPAANSRTKKPAPKAAAPAPQPAAKQGPEHSVYLKSLGITVEQVGEFRAKCQAAGRQFSASAVEARDAGITTFEDLMAYADSLAKPQEAATAEPSKSTNGQKPAAKPSQGWTLTDEEVALATQIADEFGHKYMALIAAANASGVRDIPSLRNFAATFGKEVPA